MGQTFESSRAYQNNSLEKLVNDKTYQEISISQLPKICSLCFLFTITLLFLITSRAQAAAYKIEISGNQRIDSDTIKIIS